jgi:hypothetical protein
VVLRKDLLKMAFLERRHWRWLWASWGVDIEQEERRDMSYLVTESREEQSLI